MFPFHKLQLPLYDVDDVVDPPVVEEEIVDDEVVEDKDKKTETKVEEDEEGELVRLSIGELKEAFKTKPELLKEARHAFFREQQFTERFPTIEDADKALQAQAAYDEITEAVVDGDAKKFLTQLEAESKEGVENFSKNFLPSLRETNKDLYLEITGDIVGDFVRRAYQHGVKEKSDQIKNAAKIIHKVIFGGSYEDVEKDAPLIVEKDKKEEEGKNNYLAEKYNKLYSEVHTTCYSALDVEINKGLDDLTKTKPGIKRLIAKDVKERILSDMEKDSNYLTRINGLWTREKRNGFNGSLKDSFLCTFMGKAKTLIPKYRSEARREALGKEDTTTESNRPAPGKVASGSGKKMTPERAKAEGLSTRDIFRN